MWVISGLALALTLQPCMQKPAVDAVRPVAEAPVGDCDRADAHVDAQRAAAPRSAISAVAADRVRVMRVGVRVAPGPVLAGDGQFGLDLFVVGRRSA